MKTSYTYRFIPPSCHPPFKAVTRRTFGRFDRWTEPMGLCHVRYAVFRNRRSELLIPEYDLTPETKEAIARATGPEGQP